MIEDEEKAHSHEGEALLYDYFKHLTSLCIFSLGGVLALAEKATGDGKMLIAVLAVIGTAALLSFGAAGEIVEARFKGRALNKYINFYRVASPALLSIGLGMFLYIFLATMKS